MEPITIALSLINLGAKTAHALGLIKSNGDRQLELLETKLDALIQAPLQEALDRLEQAAVAQFPSRRSSLLDEARSRASDVVAREAAPIGVRVQAALVLTSCWWNLGHPELAHAAARRVLQLQAEAIVVAQERRRRLEEMPDAIVNPASGGPAWARVALNAAFPTTHVTGKLEKAAYRRLLRGATDRATQELLALSYAADIALAVADEVNLPQDEPARSALAEAMDG